MSPCGPLFRQGMWSWLWGVASVLMNSWIVFYWVADKVGQTSIWTIGTRNGTIRMNYLYLRKLSVIRVDKLL